MIHKRLSKIVLCALGAALLVLFPAGCTGGPDAVAATLGEEFSLEMGQTASIEGEDLEITFLEVTEDSRCARDVTCIQAGWARCSVEFASTGGEDVAERVILSQPGLSVPPATEKYKVYTVTFSVTPYPERAEDPIHDDEYRLLLTFTR